MDVDKNEISSHFKEPVKLVYSFDKQKLQDSGFTNEFYVYYLDHSDSKWKPVLNVKVDNENSKVIAYTDHFTPFILVAAPLTTGTTTPKPPACIAADFPSGIGGTAGARFTTLGIGSMYYQDRNYKIDGTSLLTQDAFNSLGLHNALGISTCNGGTGAGSVAGINCQSVNTGRT